MKILIEKFDVSVLGRLRTIEVPLARMALFVVYFWFGALKMFGTSPATPLVSALFERTIGSVGLISFPVFYEWFSFFEIVIGILFLIRGMERPAFILVVLHLGMTSLPLVLLPHIAWQGFFAPTLEGQYIIKNIMIVALAVVVMSRAHPLGHNDRTTEAL